MKSLKIYFDALKKRILLESLLNVRVLYTWLTLAFKKVFNNFMLCNVVVRQPLKNISYF